ncbi:hypothetical protein K1719_008745 [Acacia pycnantha]|nr:hypothetical protein K1719_008745 [Acacia pycnantha]
MRQALDCINRGVIKRKKNHSDLDGGTEGMIVEVNPVGTELAMNNVGGEQERLVAHEPYIGLELESADDALKFYTLYAKQAGFKVRIGQLYRSRTDGSVSSRRFVCSKEGYQLSSRTGCPAFIRVQKRDSGKWVVDHCIKGHNHELEPESEGESCLPNMQQKDATGIKSVTELSHRPRKKMLQVKDELGIINFKRMRKADEGPSRAGPYVGQEFSSSNEAYQSYQAYAASVGFRVRIGQLFRSKNDGLITSRRFVCSKEGFQHPSRVGCGAYLRVKRQPSGKWVVDRLHKEHNHNLDPEQEGKPKSLPALNILTDEVDAGLVNGDLFKIDNYPVTRGARQNHIKSDWYSMLFEYFQSRQAEDTGFFHAVEIDNGNCIHMNESVDPFFGSLLNGQTPLVEFISRYERGLERRREEERKEDFNTSNFQPFMQTKEAAEDQCRRVYTLAIFKIFQKELLQSYSYLGFKIYEEGVLSRYLVRKCGNDPEKHVVTFSASCISVSCSCQMFEHEGILCRHVLRVFQILELREVPPRYILHRWTRNAENGVFPDAESWSSPHELRNLMLWSLRETACKYIDAGATSLDKYKLAYEILQEGGRKLCWHR